MKNIFSGFLSRLLLLIINGYQYFISPILPARCRYYPTCSNYAKTAVVWHGPSRGGWLALKRIGRCHPLGGHGIDFVPLPLYKYVFVPVQHQLVSRETKFIERGVYKDRSSYLALMNRQFAISKPLSAKRDKALNNSNLIT